MTSSSQIVTCVTSSLEYLILEAGPSALVLLLSQTLQALCTSSQTQPFTALTEQQGRSLLWL